MNKNQRDVTDESRKQAEETAGGILEKHLADLRKADIRPPLRYGVIYNRIIDAMHEFAALKVAEASDDIDEEEDYEVPEDVIPREEIEKITNIRREVSRKTGIPETDLTIHEPAWVCPVCGKGVSPHHMGCNCSPSVRMLAGPITAKDECIGNE